MPNESLPAKLRELAERWGGYSLPPGMLEALRDAAERIEHLEGTLLAMKWMRQAEAAAKRIEALETEVASMAQSARHIVDCMADVQTKLEAAKETLSDEEFAHQETLEMLRIAKMDGGTG